MDRRLWAFTLIELLVVIVVFGLLAVVLLPPLARAREESRKKSCQENLKEIGKGFFAYMQSWNEAYPFSWGPATSAGSPCVNQATQKFNGGEAATTVCCDAATSIGCLYPQLLDDAKVFRCPSTDDRPSFLMVAPNDPVTGVQVVDTGVPANYNQYLYSLRTWSLISRNPDKGWGASYGYDCRVYPTSVSGHAIMADLVGSPQAGGGSRAPNHADGQNVLYVDGSVKWVTTNFCSNDPMDNIYCEGGWDAANKSTVHWCADTDSFMVRGSVLLGPSWLEYTQLQQ